MTENQSEECEKNNHRQSFHRRSICSDGAWINQRTHECITDSRKLIPRRSIVVTNANPEARWKIQENPLTSRSSDSRYMPHLAHGSVRSSDWTGKSLPKFLSRSTLDMNLKDSADTFSLNSSLWNKKKRIISKNPFWCKELQAKRAHDYSCSPGKSK